MPITRDQANDIINKARDNVTKLQSCHGPHHFLPIKDDWLKSEYQCTKCGGTVYKQQHDWYILGLEHAKKKHAKRSA